MSTSETSTAGLRTAIRLAIGVATTATAGVARPSEVAAVVSPPGRA